MPKISRWSKGIGSELPEEYKKFWKEWKLQPSAAVHYIKKEGLFERNETTEEVYPVQNVPIPVIYPKEVDNGLWGGEAIVQGFKKKGTYKRRVPHFWIPSLNKSVVYSEVLDTYMKVVITQRALRLIHENYGFDHYLLKTPACDLKSLLALRLKRQILIALADKTLYPNDPKKHTEVYAKYEQYLSAYTRKEIEWYGLTYDEACKKWVRLNAEQPQPLKIQYRSELITKLKENKIKEAENVNVVSPEETSSWLNKLNPFSKSSKTQ
ncbi:PREDICTED: 39S ribosomal protein L28, mitochondrial isoform X2 [Trachymyrmex cornetzi]|nr:PREDICTED: 39S ribosomal protein L28, mitochondrial isoform X2 [Trachymyrmex cornetzi]XP_018360706.1 PREDICTED: 39S ribosomal protein L28, mitochondrial isoform X2 [Trachymyrmex cornetzi]XP_018360707.1 PREDICTED: 39S ribosomal protein L28, mitochondrial isoform X2 [Trachymyrmex cornetzi]XP_018360708.1 PREDICTED: 39S ribosomal protein L28, mitochondrial isoform X2 [Trachymyrmex cornetzi]